MNNRQLDLLKNKIDSKKLPTHVAIIMDGNGRWANQRKLPRLWGHRMGTKSVREVTEIAGEVGIKVLTMYAFSTENWSRPPREINGLMKLLKITLRREEPRLNENNVRLATIGDLSRLPEDVQNQLQSTISKLSVNTGLTLVLALNYGGRQDIIQACNSLINDGEKEVTESKIAERLYTSPYPDPDLLIRTSGELRVSNFLLWQLAYTEIFVTPTLWPDFRKEHFLNALVDYQNRQRRYGTVV